MHAQQSWLTLQQAGVVLPAAQVPLRLLPLLRPRHTPPPPLLQRLPPSAYTPRIAFRTPTSHAWTSTLHVYPSAYPRSHAHSTTPAGPSQPVPRIEALLNDREKAREQRAVDMRTAKEQLEAATGGSIESTFPPSGADEARRLADTLAASGQEPQLWNVVQRIVPERKRRSRGKTNGITLFLAHANGFHKETWEPMLESLVAHYESKGGDVEEIWNLDTYNSGHSALLNRGNLSVVQSWLDHARDMQQFLLHYMPPYDDSDGSVPTVLERHYRRADREGRDVIGIAHSHSGACMTMANLTTPGLLAGQVSVDPMMTSFDSLPTRQLPQDNFAAMGAIARKDVFASQQAVIDYMNDKPYFQAWDPRVRALHAEHGFAPLVGQEDKVDPPVTLCMSKWSEAYQFAYSYLSSWAGLCLLHHAPVSASSPWYHILFTDYFRQPSNDMMAGAPLSQTRADIERCFAAPTHTGRYTMQDVECNHLVVQEDPHTVGRWVADVLTENGTVH